MNKYGLVFHHLGLATRDPDAACHTLMSFGYEIGEQIHDPLQSVDLIMCTHSGMPDIEVISSDIEGSPVAGILQKSGEGIYHTCYETSGIDDAIRLMKEDGIVPVPVSPSKPAVLFAGRKVAFFHVPRLGLVELLEAETEGEDGE